MSPWVWLRIGAISGFLAVALGAFGAHGLKERFKVIESDTPAERSVKTRKLENWETAARYEMYHALALAAVAMLVFHAGPRGAASVAGWSFVAGTLLFSGSLYAWVLTDVHWLVHVTPVGGVALMIGWLALAIGASGPMKV